MQNEYNYAIGLMSGTSLDGVDIVYVKFENDFKKNEIIHCKTYDYDPSWKKKLQQAFFLKTDELNKLDLVYGQFLGNKVSEFLKDYDIKNVDFIASHGHTIFHEPDKGITLQIGNGQEIANVTGFKVVCDFRSQDVALGGQGAPLVPIGDELLFSEYDYCINLGGFANVSFKEDDKRIAFDISPVNIVINFYANKLGLAFDKNGEIASRGTLNTRLLNELNALAYYKEKAPKSLGIEWVNEQVFPIINNLETNISNILRTFVEHVAVQITNNLKTNKTVLFTGGGVFNSFLINRIKEISSNIVVIPNREIIDFKEAYIFAFLGLLRLQGKNNCLCSVTGASKDHSSGVIFKPMS